jgi:integrase
MQAAACLNYTYCYTPTQEALVAKTGRRQHGEGALYQAHNKACPPPKPKIVDGKERLVRPDHDCTGLWIGAVVLGYKPDGTARRKVVSSKQYKTAQRKLTALKAQIGATGSDIPTASMTVEAWCTQWLANNRSKPTTMTVNRTTVSQYLVPAIGSRRLDRLAPQHVRDLHAWMEAKVTERAPEGLAPTTIHRAHRTLVKILNDAMREGLISRNVATLVDAPGLGSVEQLVLDAEQAKTLLRSRQGDRLLARWAASLLLGARQGEVIGMEWSRVDLDTGVLDLSWQLQRLPYRHGCGGACAVKRPGSCPSAQLDVRPGFEHRRLDGGLTLTRPKAAKGTRPRRRVIPIPAPLVAFLVLHRTAQAGELNPHKLVFTRPDGRPLDPSRDNAAWHEALATAELPSVKLHAARHSTATLLLEAGVDTKVIGAILGHSTAAVTQAYQHVDLTMAREAMARLGDMLALDD